MLFRKSSFRTHAEIKDSIAESKMKIALLQPNKVDKDRMQMILDRQVDDHNARVLELFKGMIPPPTVIGFMYDSGQISKEEFKKYTLDVTGTYLPKLKEDE